MFGRRTLELLIGTAVIAGTVGVGREIYRRRTLNTGLGQALLQENLPAAMRCVRGGADPNAQPARKPTALILAVAYRDSRAALELLRVGADPNREVRWWGQPAGYCIPFEQEFRHTPLSLAAANDDLGMVRLLLQNGADPQQRDSAGHTAAERTDHQAVRELLLAGRG